MVEVISQLIRWIVVPGILLIIFVYALSISGRTPTGPTKTSANAGILAGLVVFVIYVISQLDQLSEPTFEFTNLPSLEVAPMGLGLVLGFAFLWAVRFITPTPLVGLLTLLLTAASSSALYSYIFIESLRSTMLFLTLGAALGALLHAVVLPHSIRGLRN